MSRWIEKLTRSKAAKNAGWLMGGNVVHKLLVFLLGICIARQLGPEQQGLISYATAYTTFFFSLASLGIPSVLVKQLIDARGKEGTTLGTALVLQGSAGLLALFCILGLVSVADPAEPLTLAVTVCSSLGLVFQMLGTIQLWFQYRLESRYTAIATTVACVSMSICKLLFLVLGKSSIWFAAASSAEYLCTAAILFYFYRKRNGPRLCFSAAAARDLLRTSCPYILAGLMVAVYGAADRLMLKQMLDETAVGHYGIASSIAGVWGFVLAAIVDSMSPLIMELHEKDPQDFRRRNVQLYRIILYVSLGFSVGITVFARVGIRLLYGEAYLGAVAPLRLLTWHTAFSYLGVARNAWVVCEGGQKYLTWIYAGSALINVALNALLIPCLGVTGAALASLLTQAGTIFGIPWMLRELRPNVWLMLEAMLPQKYQGTGEGDVSIPKESACDHRQR